MQLTEIQNRNKLDKIICNEFEKMKLTAEIK
jgi:hypothetical protein